MKVLQSAIYGTVYLSEIIEDVNKKLINTKKAIKILSKHLIEMAKERIQEDPLSEYYYRDSMSGHSNILICDSIFDDAAYIYMVMPFAMHGDLFEVMKNRNKAFSEEESRYLFYQILLAIKFLHSKEMALRDISLENVLLFENETNGLIYPVLNDPGQALHFNVNNKNEVILEEYTKTFGKIFRPPEIHAKCKYDPTKVDVFCVGYILYFCLTKQELFRSSVEKDIYWNMLVHKNYRELLTDKNGIHLSNDAVDLIFHCLDPNFQTRYSINQVLSHTWFKRNMYPVHNVSLYLNNDTRSEQNGKKSIFKFSIEIHQYAKKNNVKIDKNSIMEFFIYEHVYMKPDYRTPIQNKCNNTLLTSCCTFYPSISPSFVYGNKSVFPGNVIPMIQGNAPHPSNNNNTYLMPTHHTRNIHISSDDTKNFVMKTNPSFTAPTMKENNIRNNMSNCEKAQLIINSFHTKVSSINKRYNNNEKNLNNRWISINRNDSGNICTRKTDLCKKYIIFDNQAKIGKKNFLHIKNNLTKSKELIKKCSNLSEKSKIKILNSHIRNIYRLIELKKKRNKNNFPQEKCRICSEKIKEGSNTIITSITNLPNGNKSVKYRNATREISPKDENNEGDVLTTPIVESMNKKSEVVANETEVKYQSSSENIITAIRKNHDKTLQLNIQSNDNEIRLLKCDENIISRSRQKHLEPNGIQCNNISYMDKIITEDNNNNDNIIGLSNDIYSEKMDNEKSDASLTATENSYNNIEMKKSKSFIESKNKVRDNGNSFNRISNILSVHNRSSNICSIHNIVCKYRCWNRRPFNSNILDGNSAQNFDWVTLSCIESNSNSVVEKIYSNPSVSHTNVLENNETLETDDYNNEEYKYIKKIFESEEYINVNNLASFYEKNYSTEQANEKIKEEKVDAVFCEKDKNCYDGNIFPLIELNDPVHRKNNDADIVNEKIGMKCEDNSNKYTDSPVCNVVFNSCDISLMNNELKDDGMHKIISNDNEQKCGYINTLSNVENVRKNEMKSKNICNSKTEEICNSTNDSKNNSSENIKIKVLNNNKNFLNKIGITRMSEECINHILIRDNEKREYIEVEEEEIENYNPHKFMDQIHCKLENELEKEIKWEEHNLENESINNLDSSFFILINPNKDIEKSTTLLKKETNIYMDKLENREMIYFGNSKNEDPEQRIVVSNLVDSEYKSKINIERTRVANVGDIFYSEDNGKKGMTKIKETKNIYSKEIKKKKKNDLAKKNTSKISEIKKINTNGGKEKSKIKKLIKYIFDNKMKKNKNVLGNNKIQPKVANQNIDVTDGVIKDKKSQNKKDSENVQKNKNNVGSILNAPSYSNKKGMGKNKTKGNNVTENKIQKFKRHILVEFDQKYENIEKTNRYIDKLEKDRRNEIYKNNGGRYSKKPNMKNYNQNNTAPLIPSFRKTIGTVLSNDKDSKYYNILRKNKNVNNDLQAEILKNKQNIKTESNKTHELKNSKSTEDSYRNTRNFKNKKNLNKDKKIKLTNVSGTCATGEFETKQIKKQGNEIFKTDAETSNEMKNNHRLLVNKIKKNNQKNSLCKNSIPKKNTSSKYWNKDYRKNLKLRKSGNLKKQIDDNLSKMFSKNVFPKEERRKDDAKIFNGNNSMIKSGNEYNKKIKAFSTSLYNDNKIGNKYETEKKKKNTLFDCFKKIDETKENTNNESKEINNQKNVLSWVTKNNNALMKCETTKEIDNVVDDNLCISNTRHSMDNNKESIKIGQNSTLNELKNILGSLYNDITFVNALNCLNTNGGEKKTEKKTEKKYNFDENITLSKYLNSLNEGSIKYNKDLKKNTMMSTFINLENEKLDNKYNLDTTKKGTQKYDGISKLEKWKYLKKENNESNCVIKKKNGNTNSKNGESKKLKSKIFEKYPQERQTSQNKGKQIYPFLKRKNGKNIQTGCENDKKYIEEKCNKSLNSLEERKLCIQYLNKNLKNKIKKMNKKNVLNDGIVDYRMAKTEKTGKRVKDKEMLRNDNGNCIVSIGETSEENKDKRNRNYQIQKKENRQGNIISNKHCNRNTKICMDDNIGGNKREDNFLNLNGVYENDDIGYYYSHFEQIFKNEKGEEIKRRKIENEKTDEKNYSGSHCSDIKELDKNLNKNGMRINKNGNRTTLNEMNITSALKSVDKENINPYRYIFGGIETKHVDNNFSEHSQIIKMNEKQKIVKKNFNEKDYMRKLIPDINQDCNNDNNKENISSGALNIEIFMRNYEPNYVGEDYENTGDSRKYDHEHIYHSEQRKEKPKQWNNENATSSYKKSDKELNEETNIKIINNPKENIFEGYQNNNTRNIFSLYPNKWEQFFEIHNMSQWDEAEKELGNESTNEEIAKELNNLVLRRNNQERCIDENVPQIANDQTGVIGNDNLVTGISQSTNVNKTINKCNHGENETYLTGDISEYVKVGNYEVYTESTLGEDLENSMGNSVDIPNRSEILQVAFYGIHDNIPRIINGNDIPRRYIDDIGDNYSKVLNELININNDVPINENGSFIDNPFNYENHSNEINNNDNTTINAYNTHEENCVVNTKQCYYNGVAIF